MSTLSAFILYRSLVSYPSNAYASEKADVTDGTFTTGARTNPIVAGVSRLEALGYYYYPQSPNKAFILMVVNLPLQNS